MWMLVRRRPGLATRRYFATKSKSTAKEPQELPKLQAVVANTDSTARDHLANERTFLAWTRTSLGIVGLGVAISEYYSSERHISDINNEARQNRFIFSWKSDGETKNVVQKSFRDQYLTTYVPLTLVCTGGGLLFLSGWRYFYVGRLLLQGNFAPSRNEVKIVFGLSALITSMATIVVMTDPDDLWSKTQEHFNAKSDA